MKQNQKDQQTVDNEMVIAQTHVTQDLKNSVLIVSVVVNLVVFTAWVMLQVTTQFDAQFANILFTR
jgi:hypothetical protein